MLLDRVRKFCGLVLVWLETFMCPFIRVVMTGMELWNFMSEVLTWNERQRRIEVDFVLGGQINTPPVH